jgi:hypothetical protein
MTILRALVGLQGSNMTELGMPQSFRGMTMMPRMWAARAFDTLKDTIELRTGYAALS